MSAEPEVTRYDYYACGMGSDIQGKYVAYTDYDTLRAERDALAARGEGLEAALKDIASNYDHDEQTRDHTKGYGGCCRVCTAESALAPDDAGVRDTLDAARAHATDAGGGA